MYRILLGTATMLVLFSISQVATAGTIYFSDFESDDGGWTGTNDWQYGQPVGFNNPPFGGPEPVGGNSGDFAWGTVIGGAHNPSAISSLTQTFDFSLVVGGALSFFEWLDSGSNTFDEAEVLVNDTLLLLADGGPTNGWREVSLDLSAFDGQADVTIEFRFSATTVVERVGWYIDDVTISGTVIPEPSTVLMSTIGLVALVGVARRTVRRRIAS